MKYRRWLIIGMCLAGLSVAVAAIYAEFVLDARMPHSKLSVRGALSTNITYSLVRAQEHMEEMQQRYGKDAQVAVTFPGGRVTVEVNGKVIEERQVNPKFAEVLGLFVVRGEAGHVEKFPFQIAPWQELDRINRSLAEPIKTRFVDVLSDQTLAFSDQDWSIDRCATLTTETIFSPTLLRYRGGTVCLVTWAATQGKMLISVSLAEGDPWMRPFSRRVCRMITEAAIGQMVAGSAPLPNYVSCILADRPDRSGAQEILSDHIYLMRDGRLTFVK